MDEFPNPIAQASFDRVKPIVEKVDSCLIETALAARVGRI
jgi:hypothetical protein